MTYIQVLNQTLAIYRASGPQAAFEFVDREARTLTGNCLTGECYPQLDNFRYALAAAIGNKDQAMAIMKTAIEEKNFWYAYDYLNSDEDLDALRDEPDFKKWLVICKEREEEALENAEAKMLLEGNEGQAKPLLMVLHGDQENLEIVKPYWEDAIDQGYLLALVQSSQIEFSHGFNWKDVSQGVAEVGTYFEALKDQDLVNDQVWIGGFSAGCGVALRALLDGAIPAGHFIFMAPWLPDLDEWKDELEKLKAAGVTGHILVGDQDGDCREGAEALYASLKALDIPVSIEVIPGLDHDYPLDFTKRLSQWLS